MSTTPITSPDSAELQARITRFQKVHADIVTEVRKVIVGQRCYSRIDAEFTYSKDRKLISKEASGGTFVDKAAYEADQREHAPAETKNQP